MKNMISVGVVLSLAAGIATADPVQFSFPTGKLDVSSWDEGNYNLLCNVSAADSGRVFFYAKTHNGEKLKVDDAILENGDIGIEVKKGVSYKIELDDISKHNEGIYIYSTPSSSAPPHHRSIEGNFALSSINCDRVLVSPAAPPATIQPTPATPS